MIAQIKQFDILAVSLIACELVLAHRVVLRWWRVRGEGCALQATAMQSSAVPFSSLHYPRDTFLFYHIIYSIMLYILYLFKYPSSDWIIVCHSHYLVLDSTKRLLEIIYIEITSNLFSYCTQELLFVLTQHNTVPSNHKSILKDELHRRLFVCFQHDTWISDLL